MRHPKRAVVMCHLESAMATLAIMVVCAGIVWLGKAVHAWIRYSEKQEAIGILARAVVIFATIYFWVFVHYALKATDSFRREWPD